MQKREIAVVGDNSLCTGFRLAGIQRFFPAGQRDAERIIVDLMNGDGIGLIIVGEKIFSGLGFRVKNLVEKKARPVVIAVPEKTGETFGEEDSLKAMVKRAIGIELL